MAMTENATDSPPEIEVKEPETLTEALEAAYDDNVKEEAPEVEAAAEETEVVEEVAEEIPAVVLPEHWSDEDKTAYEAMDESGREWALRLETNASKGIQQKSEELKKFRDVIEPYKHLFNGVDETQAIQQLLNAQASLTRDPVAGIKWLMKSFGVDEKQFQPSEIPADDEFVDPEIKTLRTEVKALREKADGSAKEAQQQHENAVLASIAEFRDATDDDGVKLHPHFTEVYGVMGGLLQSGRVPDMEAAYEKAVLTVPEYMDEVVQQRIREKDAEQVKERDKEAAKAKKTAITVQGKSSAKTPPRAKTMSEELSENYDKSIKGEL